ncbi:glycosyltransferase family 4 protein [bacterium]|nr:glycosyltransferase family 4 protein [bacterium]
MSRPGGRAVACVSAADSPPRDSSPLRLLVLNYEYPPLGGGASPVTGAICRELAARGHHVDVVTMAYRSLPREETIGTLRILRIPCLRAHRHICRSYELATWVVSALVAASRLAGRGNYDVVHAHFFFPSAIVAWWLKRRYGLPYVVTSHGSDVPAYNPDRFRALHVLLRPVWRAVVRGADLVISPSRSLSRLIDAALGAPYPLEIVPNGIERDWIAPGPDDRANILLVSRLFERKGMQYLLRALARGPLARPVHIVGDGPYREPLEKLARSVPDPVTFHGWLEPGSPPMLDLYRCASIFVFPSVSENFPISLLEAMFAGTAVVASDLESCREVLGDTAEYFPPGDDEALRKILERLVADPEACRDMGRRARQRVLDHFTWDQVGAQYEEHLRSQRRRR